MEHKKANYNVYLSDGDKELLGKLAVENDICPSQLISNAIQMYAGWMERSKYTDGAASAHDALYTYNRDRLPLPEDYIRYENE